MPRSDVGASRRAAGRLSVVAGTRAYGLLLASAIRDPDPVIFLESRCACIAAGPTRQEVADDGKAMLLDVCYKLREGSDITLVTWGAMTVETLKAAQELAQDGVSCEVLDLATLSPIDHEAILESVAKTGRLVIIHEAPRNCGIGAEIAAPPWPNTATYDLHAPIKKRVTGYDTIIPLSRLEYEYIPSVARIHRRSSRHPGRAEHSPAPRFFARKRHENLQSSGPG